MRRDYEGYHGVREVDVTGLAGRVRVTVHEDISKGVWVQVIGFGAAKVKKPVLHNGKLTISNGRNSGRQTSVRHLVQVNVPYERRDKGCEIDVMVQGSDVIVIDS